MSSVCEFEFNHENRVYFSGDAVKVRIHLTTTKEKTVEEIHIRFLGESQVHWLVPHTQNYYEHRETHMDNMRVVHTAVDSPTLPAGRHTYTFAIKIPASAASTCREEFGSISYTCRLVLKRKQRYDNEFIEMFKVVRELNLTDVAQFAYPIEDVRLQKHGCVPCCSGPVLTIFQIPKSIYENNEKMHMKIIVENLSRSKVRYNVTVELLQHFEFVHHRSAKASKFLTKILEKSELQLSCIGQCCKQLKIDQNIPAVLPTTADGLILVYYTLKIVMTRGTKRRIHQLLHMPLVIGTNSSTDWDNKSNVNEMPLQGARFCCTSSDSE